MNGLSKLDALHAEMLGDLQEVLTRLAGLKADLPALGDSARKESEAAVGVIKEACEDFRAQAFALAEFIKLRKADVLHHIQQSTAQNEALAGRALQSLRPWLWLLSLLGFANLLVLAVMVTK